MRSKSKKLAKAKAVKYFSEYIRLWDSTNGIGSCITCGKIGHYKEMHCGHFMSRRYESTRYDEKNCAMQCPACNTFNQGRQFEFGLAIDQIYGQGTAANLLQKSQMLCKRNQYDYESIAQEFKDKLIKLQP